MISDIQSVTGSNFCATVGLYLHVSGETIELGQLGPDFAILRAPQCISASEGELETIIDGQSSRWKIRITSPITASERKFSFEAA